MSAPKETRVADSRRRERPGELEGASMDAPSMKKVPGDVSKSLDQEDEEEVEVKQSMDYSDEEIVSPVTSSPGSATESDVAHQAPLVSSPPIVPKLSPTIHVRSSSSLGFPSRSPESPRLTARRHFVGYKPERRESLLGRHSELSDSPKGASGLSSSLKDQVSVAPFLELDTDSDDDSPFPPPISYTEQVSHSRSVPVTLRVRQNANVPINNTQTRKMLSGIRERRLVQERSSIPNPETSPTNGSPMSPRNQSPKPLVYHLERGGVVVGTSIGPIQFGIPPETIKDSLSLGFEVPQIYIAPKNRFDTVAGLNMCEVEFPGYYQFFLRNRSMTIVCSTEAERSLRSLMHEILQGPPEAHLYTSEECFADYDARPDHVKEMNYFVRPRNGRSITVDSLFSFVTFEQCHPIHAEFLLDGKVKHEGVDGESIVAVARIPGGEVEIHETQKEWIVFDRGVEVAKVEFWQASNVPPRYPLAMVLPTKTFVPPVLGVTVLGSSHGFDAKQSTSGFVLWMHGRGIMVDPPPNATDLLKRGGISPRWISAIILTHCHADHDAGTFQKILVEGRVTLMTTKTIMASFLRKYSKISGFTEAFLCRLFEPRIVKIGEDVFYGGGTIRFHYALHALPCIGFQVFVAGKSIAYSADTLYEPKTLNDLCEEGVLSVKRRDSLLSFPFETADLVIHEAGIPPIHTPVDTLKALSENARSRLYLIHIAESAAEASGLRLARAGTEHTIRVAEGDSHAFNLDVLTNSELFFPYLTSMNKFGRGIVTAAQERMGLMDYENPNPQDFSFLDCSNAGGKRFYTSSNPGYHRDRGSSMMFHGRSSNLLETGSGNARDSDLSFSSIKRHSAGFENISPTRNLIAGRRTSASTNRSLLFAPELDEDDFTVPQVADLLRLAKKSYRDADEIVSAVEGEGDTGLYLIMKGFCRVEKTMAAKDAILDEDLVQPAEGPVGTILEPGDCFGLFTVNEHRQNNQVRKCAIRTLTEVELIELDMNALWYLLNVYPALDRRLSRMHELRALEAWRTMELNSCLRRLASFQRTQLNAVLELKEFKQGEELWTKRPGPRNAYLVAEGELGFPELSEDMGDRPFGAGAFLCDFHSMIVNRRPSSTSTISSAVQAVQQLAAPPILASHDLLNVANTVNNSSSNSMTSGEQETHQSQLPTVTLVAQTDCRLYQINWRDVFQFLESNPGVLVQIYHSFVVE